MDIVVSEPYSDVWHTESSTWGRIKAHYRQRPTAAEQLPKERLHEPLPFSH